MPRTLRLLDTETGEIVERIGADATEMLKQADGRYKPAEDLTPKPLAVPRELPGIRVGAPPKGETDLAAPYVPPSERAVQPDPAFVRATKKPLTARGQARVNTKKARAAGAKALKRKATIAAKNPAPAATEVSAP